MTAPTSDNTVFVQVCTGLRNIGFRGDLLRENYGFSDWFSQTRVERQAAAVAFGQTPVSYDSSLIGVAHANGVRGQSLVNGFRAIGAPIILEIDNTVVREWAVSRKDNSHGLVETYPSDRLGQLFIKRAADWRPETLLRAKNIGSFQWLQQLGLFSGLVPELEERIQSQLDPLLRSTLSSTKSAYRKSAGRDPDPSQLFKLVFWMLTAKVFRDRRVNGFGALTDPTPDELLEAVASQYKEAIPKLLNREAREAAAESIWSRLDFRNLSVEILAQIWSTTLLDADTQNRLGIHRTPRTIVPYIVDRVLPAAESGDDKRVILEPCSGSGAFLIGAMHALRDKLFLLTPAERHQYFVNHLVGIEKDPFGVEISKLALTLADFPNPGGWQIDRADVFHLGAMTRHLKRASVVLCNPPFRDFGIGERSDYELCSPKKPVELLHRILSDLHPSGVLGFVLPRNIVDGGGGYSDIRRLLSERFARVELTLIPDKAFEADPEVALMIATDPIPHGVTHVVNRKVNDDAESWRKFELAHEVSTEHESDLEPGEAEVTFNVPELPEVWDAIINYPTLGEVATLHRGIEWNKPLTLDGQETGQRQKLIRRTDAPGFRAGIPPRTRFDIFQRPETSYLDLKPENARGHAYAHPWSKPKAIVNKATRSRGRWRLAAFPDSNGLVCYQTFIAVWPKAPTFDESLLAAVLNSPVANAFVATREGKTDITMDTLARLPVPLFTSSQAENLRSLVREYQRIIETLPLRRSESDDPAKILMDIDALVLDGYRMPPRVERQLLDYFRGYDRPTSHPFGEYVPKECDVYFSLSDYLSPEFKDATAGRLRKRLAAARG